VNHRLPAWLRHAMYNLRGGFLVRPLIIALTLGCAGAVFSWLEETFPFVSGFVPRALFPSHADPQVAQVVLGGIAASIMTVVSIVFAIVLMTLTLASMQFSPRIIVSFARDRVTQWTLGIFLGTFCYCMAALPAARSQPKPFAPVATVLGAMLLALACVGWLLFFIHHITQAISVSHIVDRIATESVAMLETLMREPRKAGSIPQPPEPHGTDEAPVLGEASGYIRFIDIPALVGVAKSCHVTLRVARRVGQFVPAGTPLVMATKASRITPEKLAEIRDAFDLGPARTLEQDVEFGVLQIVDIALKAISPAVNDPTTAISSIDQLSRILIHFVRRAPLPGSYFDPPGILRLTVPWIDFDHLANSAFEQVRMYAKGDVAVSLRMLRALGDIAAASLDPAEQRTLREQARRTVAGCSERLSEEEMRPLRARLAAMENMVATEVR
jgi:uncharacterized membrane protein